MPEFRRVYAKYVTTRANILYFKLTFLSRYTYNYQPVLCEKKQCNWNLHLFLEWLLCGTEQKCVSLTNQMVVFAGLRLVRAVLLGSVQGHVTHAVYRLRPVSAAVDSRPVDHHAVHDMRRHVLRPLHWTHHQPDTVAGLFSTPLPWQGTATCRWRSSLCPCLAGRLLAGAVLLGPVQGHVAHAVYRLRPVSAAVSDWHVAHHAVHGQRGHLLRHVPGPRHQSDSEPGLVPETVPRKGGATLACWPRSRAV